MIYARINDRVIVILGELVTPPIDRRFLGHLEISRSRKTWNYKEPSFDLWRNDVGVVISEARVERLLGWSRMNNLRRRLFEMAL